MKRLIFTMAALTALPIVVYAQPLEVNIAFKSSVVSPEDAVGSVILDISTRLNAATGLSADAEELKSILGNIVTSSTQEATKAYEALSAKSATAETTLVNNSGMGFQFKDVGKRLSALRRGAKQASTSHFRRFGGSYHSFSDDSSAGSSTPGNSPLSGFFSGDFSNANQTETVTEVGFDAGSNRFSGGADYRLNDSAFTGAALSYLSSSVDLANGKGSLDAKEFGATFYGTYYLNQSWYMDGVFAYNKRMFELSREIKFTITPTTYTKTATSSPDGNQISAAINLGREFVWNNGFTMSLQSGLFTAKSDIAAFDESNAGGLSLHVDEQTMKSLTLNAGVNVSKPVGLGFGVLVPQASLYGYHDFSQSGEVIRARFVNDPYGTQFSFTTSDKDQDYLGLSAGASFILPGGTTSFLQWSTQQLIEHFSQWQISLGVRAEF